MLEVELTLAIDFLIFHLDFSKYVEQMNFETNSKVHKCPWD